MVIGIEVESYLPDMVVSPKDHIRATLLRAGRLKAWIVSKLGLRRIALDNRVLHEALIVDDFFTISLVRARQLAAGEWTVLRKNSSCLIV